MNIMIECKKCHRKQSLKNQLCIKCNFPIAGGNYWESFRIGKKNHFKKIFAKTIEEARAITSNHYPSPYSDWKGKKHKNKKGYIALYFPGHSNASKNGMIFEHVAIMSELIGRSLLPGETVHHKNGIRDDNRPRNLELRTKNNHGNHQGIKDLIPYWLKMLQVYKPEYLREEFKGGNHGSKTFLTDA